MIKRFFVLIILLLIFILIFALAFVLTKFYIDSQYKDERNDTVEIIEENNDFKIYNDRRNQLRYVTTKLKPEIIYNSSQKLTVRDVSLQNNFQLAINGGFFDKENNHAGLLEIDNKTLSPIAPLDTQLSHILAYDRNDNTYSFYETNSFVSDKRFSFAFQSGPIFLQNNIIQSDFINNSINGNGLYQRSFIGNNSNGETIIGITLNKQNLNDLSNRLLDQEVFKDTQFTIINLDGGSSVSLFMGKSNDLNYGQYKTLPTIIGFK